MLYLEVQTLMTNKYVVENFVTPPDGVILDDDGQLLFKSTIFFSFFWLKIESPDKTLRIFLYTKRKAQKI